MELETLSQTIRKHSLTQRAVLGVYVACFAVGAFNHGRDFLSYGSRPYNWAPALLEAFWSALLFLDLATIGLLLLGKLRVGLALAVAIMISDVAANSYGFFVLGIPGFKVALPLQAAFLGFVLGSAPFLWPNRETA